MYSLRHRFRDLVYLMREREKLDIMTMIEFDRGLNDGRLSWEAISLVIRWILRWNEKMEYPDWKLELLARRYIWEWEYEEITASRRRELKFIQRILKNYQ